MQNYLEKAEKYLSSKPRLEWLIQQVDKKTEKNRKRILNVLDKIRTLQRMLKASIKGEYKDIPWSTLLMVVAALLYFINPFDLIPDFVVTIGFIDDVTMISLIANSISEDLEKFTQWELEQGQLIDEN